MTKKPPENPNKKQRNHGDVPQGRSKFLVQSLLAEARSESRQHDIILHPEKQPFLEAHQVTLKDLAELARDYASKYEDKAKSDKWYDNWLEIYQTRVEGYEASKSGKKDWATAIASENIREAINKYLTTEKWLPIFEKLSPKGGHGSELWSFKLTLWSTDLEENGKAFDLAWDKKKGLPDTDRILSNLDRVTDRDEDAFFGRDQDLKKLHDTLQQHAIVALVGMGGIGKTEASIQYANRYTTDYKGGTWWVSVPVGDLVGQIVSITKQRFHEFSRDTWRDLTLEDLAQKCWQQWAGKGKALVIFDDVEKYAEIYSYLPPRHGDVAVLLTTREAIEEVKLIWLDILEPEPALELLLWAIAKTISAADLAEAPSLCADVGYLPLALELVGKYFLKGLDRGEVLSISQLRMELGYDPTKLTEEEKKEAKKLRLSHGALQVDARTNRKKGQQSLTAALKLSWERLRGSAQLLAEIFGRYAIGGGIERSIIEDNFLCYMKLGNEEYDRVALRDDLLDLIDRSFLKMRRSEDRSTGSTVYSIHPLVHQFFRDKLEGKL